MIAVSPVPVSLRCQFDLSILFARHHLVDYVTDGRYRQAITLASAVSVKHPLIATVLTSRLITKWKEGITSFRRFMR